jgi:hypothetical protein
MRGCVVTWMRRRAVPKSGCVHDGQRRRGWHTFPPTPFPANCEVAGGCVINLSFVRVADQPPEHQRTAFSANAA